MEKQTNSPEMEKMLKDAEALKSFLEPLEKSNKFDSLYVFSGFYSLATDINGDFREQFEKHDKLFKELLQKEQQLRKEIQEYLKAVFASEGIVFDFHTSGRDGEYSSYWLRDIEGKSIFFRQNSEWDPVLEYDSTIEVLELSSKEIQRLLEIPQIKKYFDLQEKSDIISKMRLSRAEKNLQKYTYYTTQEIKTCKKMLPRVQQLLVKLNSNEVMKQKSAELERARGERLALNHEDLRSNLSSYSYSVLAMKVVKFFNENYEVLRMHPKGAKDAAKEALTLEGYIIDTSKYYYMNSSINAVIKNLDAYRASYKIAAKLHENWRNTRLTPTGEYEPRWKKIQDPQMLQELAKTDKLPANIRLVDGVYEQDIANTKFEDLCANYQIENFRAAEVAYEVSQTQYSRDDAGKVGKIIHDEWLKRNPYAKGSELDVKFFDLPRNKQVKDLIHYVLAAEAKNEMDLEYNQPII